MVVLSIKNLLQIGQIFFIFSDAIKVTNTWATILSEFLLQVNTSLLMNFLSQIQILGGIHGNVLMYNNKMWSTMVKLPVMNLRISENASELQV